MKNIIKKKLIAKEGISMETTVIIKVVEEEAKLVRMDIDDIPEEAFKNGELGEKEYSLYARKLVAEKYYDGGAVDSYVKDCFKMPADDNRVARILFDAACGNVDPLMKVIEKRENKNDRDFDKVRAELRKAIN